MNDETDPLKLQVQKLLRILSTCDPTPSPERNPDWPLMLIGDDAAIEELRDCVNELHRLSQ